MQVPVGTTFQGLPIVQVCELHYSSRNGRLIDVTFKTNLPHTDPIYHVKATNVRHRDPLRILIKVSNNNIFPELADWTGQLIILENRTDEKVLEFD